MNKDIKLLIKIIIYSVSVFALFLVILFVSKYSHEVYACEDTGGDWIFIKANYDECINLSQDECRENPKCVYTIASLAGGFSEENLICIPDSGCRCEQTWSSGRGCYLQGRDGEVMRQAMFYVIFILLSAIAGIIFLLIKLKRKNSLPI